MPGSRRVRCAFTVMPGYQIRALRLGTQGPGCGGLAASHSDAGFVPPGPAKMGGVTEPMKALPATALRNVTVMPHTCYDGLGVLPTLRVPAVPGTVIEWRWPPDPAEDAAMTQVSPATTPASSPSSVHAQ